MITARSHASVIQTGAEGGITLVTGTRSGMRIIKTTTPATAVVMIKTNTAVNIHLRAMAIDIHINQEDNAF